MQTHKNGKGKTACRIKPEAKEVEVVWENWKVLVRFNPDYTADAINYFPFKKWEIAEIILNFVDKSIQLNIKIGYIKKCINI
jgi:hypothetical protein